MNENYEQLDPLQFVEYIKKQAAREENERLAQVIARDYPYSTLRGTEVAQIIRARRID